ncbi:MAG: ERCC4 domain-containing protein [Candidatus Micrarchaeia archaeon]
MKPPNPRIAADDRETKSKACKKLVSLGALVESTRLPVADFIASKNVAIERKTANDFESSIIDGRIFKQAAELNKNYKSPLICVTGKSHHQRLNPKAVQGALISLATDYKIPLFFFKNDEDLGEFIYACAFKEQFIEKKEIRLNAKKLPTTLPKQQQFIIESLPGIGAKHAKNLLEHFESVKAVFNASEKELSQLEGIGKTKAEKIRKILGAKHEKD